MTKKIIIIAVIVLIAYLLITNIFLWQTTSYNEKIIKKLNERIEAIETQLLDLQKQQLEYENKIAKLKYKRQSIKKPVTNEETIERFKALGYNPL